MPGGHELRTLLSSGPYTAWGHTAARRMTGSCNKTPGQSGQRWRYL
jgi:hypothetical protein